MFPLLRMAVVLIFHKTKCRTSVHIGVGSTVITTVTNPLVIHNVYQWLN